MSASLYRSKFKRSVASSNDIAPSYCVMKRLLFFRVTSIPERHVAIIYRGISSPVICKPVSTSRLSDAELVPGRRCDWHMNRQDHRERHGNANGLHRLLEGTGDEQASAFGCRGPVKVRDVGSQSCPCDRKEGNALGKKGLRPIRPARMKASKASKRRWRDQRQGS